MPFDGTPPAPKAPALDLPSVYRRTLANLDRLGWGQGMWNGVRGVCLGEALRRAVASELGRSAIKRGDPRVREAAAGLGFDHLGIDPMSNLIRFNDHQGTTESEVRSLLLQHS